MKVINNYIVIKVLTALYLSFCYFIVSFCQSPTLDTIKFNCICTDNITPKETPNLLVPTYIIRKKQDTLVESYTFSSISFTNKNDSILYKVYYNANTDTIKLITFYANKMHKSYFFKNREDSINSIVTRYPFGNLVLKNRIIQIENIKYFFFNFDNRPQISFTRFFYELTFDENFNIVSYGFYDSLSPFKCIINTLHKKDSNKILLRKILRYNLPW